MTAVYFDPYLFACPHPSLGVAAFRDYVESLLGWSETKDAGVSLFTTARTYEVLVETGQYPVWDAVQRALTALGVRDTQAKDVMDVTHGLLDRIPRIEDAVGISEMLLDIRRFEMPTEEGTPRVEAFVHVLHCLVALMCLHRDASGDTNSSHVLASRSVEEGASVALEAQIVAAEGRSSTLQAWPAEVVGLFPVCVNQSRLARFLDPLALWSEADRSQDPVLLRYALEVAVDRTRRESGKRASNWVIGRSFAASVWRLPALKQDGHARSTVRACVETVLGLNLGATHALRVGPGPAEDQLRRGSDKAWRRDIDREYHLHYWETCAGLELACVCQHADMRIPF